MQLGDESESSNVEDRRGGGIGVGGLGVGGVVVALIASYFLGIDPRTLLGVAEKVQEVRQTASPAQGQAIDPANTYFKFIMPQGLTWAVWTLAGVFLGGLVSALLSGTFKFRKMPDQQWESIFGKSPLKRWVIVFFAAALLEYAAGIAGGCTSGLAISGGVVLAPASFIFMAGMFAAGIPTAMLIYRKKY